MDDKLAEDAKLAPLDDVADAKASKGELVPAEKKSGGRRDSGDGSDGESTNERELQDEAATDIQCAFRKWVARREVLGMIRDHYEKVWEPDYDCYFYFNARTEDSSWEPPKVLRGEPYDPLEEPAAIAIQTMGRRVMAKERARDVLFDRTERVFDPVTKEFFYHDTISDKTFWDKPKLLRPGEDIEANVADATLAEREDEVATLKRELEEERRRFAEFKAKRFNDVRELVKQSDIEDAKGRLRSKHMDDWTFQEVSAWLDEDLNCGHYCELIIQNRVDGVLMLNLNEEELIDMGITSKLSLRRIEVGMRKYRIRFERGIRDDDDDGLSDMSVSDTPSELLDEEDGQYAESEESDGDGSVQDYDLADLPITEDELVEMRRDEQFIDKELKHKGDGEHMPQAGDIVRIHMRVYDSKKKQIEDTKRWRKRPLEVVLGTSQLTRGVERSILTMTKGERAVFTIQAEYGYKDKEFPPFLPVGEVVTYDIQLVSFRTRPTWIKPLIQKPGLTEKPYYEDDTELKLEYSDTATAHGLVKPIEDEL
uniref:peptidylprolyl isomerase n=1 Tax=Phaeomonas parva TaxID=124430 RepID=A0A7S1TPB3_9STRA